MRRVLKETVRTVTIERWVIEDVPADVPSTPDLVTAPPPILPKPKRSQRHRPKRSRKRAASQT